MSAWGWQAWLDGLWHCVRVGVALVLVVGLVVVGWEILVDEGCVAMRFAFRAAACSLRGEVHKICAPTQPFSSCSPPPLCPRPPAHAPPHARAPHHTPTPHSFPPHLLPRTQDP